MPRRRRPGTPVSNLQMTPVGPTCGATNSATCVFQGQYTLPSTPTPPLGSWNIRVRGIEGVEGVFDEGLGFIRRGVPAAGGHHGQVLGAL